MAPISVRHYRGFHADQRKSMDIYADSLASALASADIDLDVFMARSGLERYSSNRLIMRYLRYWQYPHSLSKSASQVHHVMEHGYAHLLPYLAKGKTCITAHDLIPLLQWKGVLNEAAQKPRKPWLNLKSLSYLSGYDHIIALSENTKRDLITYLNLPEEDITAIAPVIDARYGIQQKNLVDNFAKKYQLNESSKWLMVSGREFYKNHETALKVLGEVNAHSDADIRLIKTGLPSPEFDAMVSSMKLNAQVSQLYLEDLDELPLLYNFIDCLLFPSLYEGFGMPVAEALACGTPAVISNRGSLPEVGGVLCAQLDAFDVEGLSRSVLEALGNQDYRSEVVTEGPKWVEQFQAAAIAEKIEQVYIQLLD